MEGGGILYEPHLCSNQFGNQCICGPDTCWCENTPLSSGLLECRIAKYWQKHYRHLFMSDFSSIKKTIKRSVWWCIFISQEWVTKTAGCLVVQNTKAWRLVWWEITGNVILGIARCVNTVLLRPSYLCNLISYCKSNLIAQKCYWVVSTASTPSTPDLLLVRWLSKKVLLPIRPKMILLLPLSCFVTNKTMFFFSSYA